MGFFSLISYLHRNRIAEIAEDVASRCQDAVWQKVRGRLGTLGLNQARGYIRARSAAIIQDEVEHLIVDQQAVKESQRLRLTDLATDAVIRLITSQARVVKQHTTPIRKAA